MFCDVMRTGQDQPATAGSTCVVGVHGRVPLLYLLSSYLASGTLYLTLVSIVVMLLVRQLSVH
jgi:hypothetical protein